MKWLRRESIPLSISPICSDPPVVRKRAWDSLSVPDFACGPEIEAGGKFGRTVESRSGDNVTLACTFSSDPPSVIEWSKAGQVLTNTTHQVTVREFGHNTRTSILEIRSVSSASRGLYQCRAFNKGGQAVDS